MSAVGGGALAELFMSTPLVAQQRAALLLCEQIAGHAAEHPFLKPGVAVRPCDDNPGAFILSEDGKSIGYADQGLCRDSRSADFPPNQPTGHVVDTSFGCSFVSALV